MGPRGGLTYRTHQSLEVRGRGRTHALKSTGGWLSTTLAGCPRIAGPSRTHASLDERARSSSFGGGLRRASRRVHSRWMAVRVRDRRGVRARVRVRVGVRGLRGVRVRVGVRDRRGVRVRVGDRRGVRVRCRRRGVRARGRRGVRVWFRAASPRPFQRLGTRREATGRRMSEWSDVALWYRCVYVSVASQSRGRRARRG